WVPSRRIVLSPVRPPTFGESVRARLLWVLLIGLGAALIALIVWHDGGTIAGLDTDDFASLAVKISLLVFIGSAVLVMFRHRFSEALQAALIWVVIALALVVVYTYRTDLRDVGER